MHMRKSKEATLLKTIINNFTCLEKLLIYYGQKVLKMKVERKKNKSKKTVLPLQTNYRSKKTCFMVLGERGKKIAEKKKSRKKSTRNPLLNQT